MSIRKWLVAALVCAALAPSAQAEVITVNGLGEHGWVSGDTRPPTGGSANAAQIAAQIKFLGEGQNVADAAGNLPGNSPAGSLNGAGYVRLDGTNANSGKSDISHFGNLGSAGALLTSDFFVDYRYFNDANPSSRTIGLNIEVASGNIFSHVKPDNVANAWNLESVDQDTGLFYLYGPGASGGAGPLLTLADWAANPAWNALFNLDITRLGFNLGSYQSNNLTYLDWVQTSLLNGGDTIDFQDAALAEVPEPASLAIWSLIGVAGLAYRRRRKNLASASIS